MIESLRARVFVIIVVAVAAIIYILPNFVNVPPNWWLPKDKIVYGLDIQGGAHLVMGVDVPGVIAEKINRLSRTLDGEMKEKQIPVESITSDGKEVIVKLKSVADHDKVKKYLDDFYPGTVRIAREDGATLYLQYFDQAIEQIRKDIVNQSIEVLRNRIDEFGVAEPSIAAQGGNRIVIQLPGIKDSARAKDLINRTARLDFRMVSDEISPNMVEQAKALDDLIKKAEDEGKYALGKDGLRYQDYVKRLNGDLKGKIPAGTMVAFEKLENVATIENGKRPWLLKTESSVTGDQLEDAHVRPDQYGAPEVQFKLDPEGRRRFAESTGANVGKIMAIVLDEVVQSAPQIKGRIDSDTAVITLGGGRDHKTQTDEANLIATALRAGALPAALTQLEERTVGPSLGADSIEKGRLASIVGCLLIFVFMVIYYRGLGFVAVLALSLNFVLTLAVLTSLGATLTLPGIAGLALTIGMAVDSNVIIFERIKEELRRGVSAQAAIREGFANAFSAIFDSNVTTVATSIVLLVYGSGPVKGFAITLIAGIITSMFSSVFFARTVLEVLVTKFNIRKIASV